MHMSTILMTMKMLFRIML